MIAREKGAKSEEAFVRSLAADDFVIAPVTSSGLERAADLVGQYADLPLGFVDASVVALAEQLELREIATLDRRHFSVIRPQHINAFALLP
ncbi:PIN domain-containing protein [Kribbella sp. NPDC051718]|uniref:PIN domain-containing protein n=1 Tax=Kribbella sp. NPDC051718 TaxID=3155168 RepID=UPI003425AAF5